MANQPETASYDSGVYQLATTDPVQGGVGGIANAPLLNLANRTAYLKQHVDNIENGTTVPTGLAVKNSPIFTGDPQAPTPALGDNDTSISTTAFVQSTINGVLTKSVAGGVNVTLSAIEAGNGILILTGALTANIAVIVPTSGKQMLVVNRTTGAYSLTVKTASGTGIVVAQGYQQELACDGVNVILASNDFTSILLAGSPTLAASPATADNSLAVASTAFVKAQNYITSGGAPVQSVAGRGGNVALAVGDISGAAPLSSPGFTNSPTAPTAAQFDSSGLLANTYFVKRAAQQFLGVTAAGASRTLGPADFGTLQVINGPGTLYLPYLNSASYLGQSLTINNAMGSGAFTLVVQGADTMNSGLSTFTYLVVQSGDTLVCTCIGIGSWIVYGTAALQKSGSFSNSFGVPGYQKLPSGLILQWGVASNSGSNYGFPIAFPSSCIGIVGCENNSSSGSPSIAAEFAPPSNTSFTCWIKDGANNNLTSVSVRYLAWGY